jgi:diacylglycerol kinase (ATP)
MQESKESFIKNRVKSIGYAYRGALLLIKTEASIKVQFSIAIIIVILGFYFNISATEWMLQLLAIGLVISIEAANTAIEKIADFIHPEYHKKIGVIKDVAAGAVFLSALFASAIGFIIYLPKLIG